jgi:hypothetical protein
MRGSIYEPIRFALAVVALVIAAPGAQAQAAGERDPAAPAQVTPFGISASVGAGVTEFVVEDMQAVTDIGASWQARLVLGTRRLLALEIAYSGSAQSLDMVGLDDDSILVSTGLEADVRLNLIETGKWQPYAAAGLGWRRYAVANSDFNQSTMADDDRLLEVPFGAGLAFRYRGLVLDARALYRVAIGSDLVRAVAGEGPQETDLHRFGASIDVGWEL